MTFGNHSSLQEINFTIAIPSVHDGLAVGGAGVHALLQDGGPAVAVVQAGQVGPDVSAHMSHCLFD